MHALAFLRQFRIANFAVFDFAISFVAVYFLSPLLTKPFAKWGAYVPRKSWLYFTVPLAILVHVLTRTQTPLTRQFLDPSAHYLVKIIVLALFLLGLRGVRKSSRRSS